MGIKVLSAFSETLVLLIAKFLLSKKKRRKTNDFLRFDKLSNDKAGFYNESITRWRLAFTSMAIGPNFSFSMACIDAIGSTAATSILRSPIS